MGLSKVGQLSRDGRLFPLVNIPDTTYHSEARPKIDYGSIPSLLQYLLPTIALSKVRPCQPCQLRDAATGKRTASPVVHMWRLSSRAWVAQPGRLQSVRPLATSTLPLTHSTLDGITS